MEFVAWIGVFVVGFVAAKSHTAWINNKGHVTDGVLMTRVRCSEVTGKSGNPVDVTLHSEGSDTPYTCIWLKAESQDAFGLGLDYQVEIRRIES